jgi:small subunit ribosomal protein S1
VNGKVVRLAPFGAFVKLEPGVEGLLHISNMGTGRRINHPKEAVEVDQLIETYVLSADAGQRKISLSMQPKPKPKKIDFPAIGDQVEGVIEKIMPFGIFIKMKNGLTGLIPNHETGTSRGTDHDKMFPVGTTIELVVVDVDTVHKKVKLSRKGLMEKKEQEEVDRYKHEMKEQEKSSDSFSSFGKLLKAKLEEKNFTL